MPTVADLERLKALTDRLNPIADVTQGELIRAGDWNTLVGAVQEIARAVLTEDHETTPAPHEHPDQVTSGWLEPRLRALIERGPLSDPAALTRLSALEQRIERLISRVEALNGNLGEVRDRVTDVTTKDLIRQSDVTQVRRVVDSLSDSRESVLQIRETLKALQDDVSVAVTVGKNLVVDGQPVDMQALSDRVGTVEALRDRLTLPDGNLFDASTVEHRLTELTNTLVTQDVLDEALKNVTHEIPPDQLAGIEGNLRNELLAQVNSSMDTLSGQIRADTDVRLQQVGGLVAQAVSNATPNIINSALTAIRPEITTAVTSATTQTQTQFQQLLTEAVNGLNADFGQKIDDVQLGIASAVTQEFQRQLPAQFEAINSQVTQLAKTVEPMADRLTVVDTKASQTATRVETVNQDLISRLSTLSKDVTQQLDQRDQVLRAEMDTRFTEANTLTLSQIDQAILANQRTILDQANQAAITAATNQVNLMSTQLRTDMVTISRDQIAGVQDQLRDSVQTQVNTSLSVLPGMVTDEVKRATAATLPQMVKSEVEAIQPTLRDNIVSDVINLRPPQ